MTDEQPKKKSRRVEHTRTENIQKVIYSLELAALSFIKMDITVVKEKHA